MNTPSTMPAAAPVDDDMSPISCLPFVRGTPDERARDNRFFWSPIRTDDPETDWVLGEAFARQAIDVAVAEREPYLMMWIMEGLVASGRFDALERGFVTGLTAANMGGEDRR